MHHDSRLYATYNKSQTLFFLLEPVLGGELFTVHARSASVRAHARRAQVLRDRRLFDEPTTKFFSGSTLAFATALTPQ
jgi:hypothetical protein